MEETKVKIVRKVKMRRWLEGEIKTLLKSWKTNFYLKRLSNPKRQGLFYNAIRKDLQKHDYDRPVNEIMAKIYDLQQTYRRKKQSTLKDGEVGNFPFFDALTDIEKLELQTDSVGINSKKLELQTDSVDIDSEKEELQTDSVDIDSEILELHTDFADIDSEMVTSDEKDEEIIEEVNNPELIQMTKENLANESKEDITKNTSLSINNPQSTSDDIPTTTEDVLLNFFKSYQKVNCQLKRNDAILVQLLREQNEIFQFQMALIKKLIAQD